MDSVYTFRKQNRDGSYIEMTSKAISWPELVEEFQQFLSGCGFILPKGELQIVDEEWEFNFEKHTTPVVDDGQIYVTDVDVDKQEEE